MKKRILELLLCLSMIVSFLPLKTITVKAATSIVSGSEIKNAAKDAGISSGSNAYKALELINAYSDDLTSSQKKGTLVFLFEGVGNSSSASKRKNAMCVVIKNNKIKYVNRNSTTIPDRPFDKKSNPDYDKKTGRITGYTDVPTLKSGIYTFTTVNHKQTYAALNVNNAKVFRYSESKKSFYNGTSKYINVHRRSNDSNSPAGATWANSAGCQNIGNIGTSATAEYAKFIQAVGIVDSGDNGVTKYKHSIAGKIIVDRSFATNYLSNIGYPKETVKALCGTTKTIPDSEPDDDLTKDTKYKTPISCVAYKKMDVYYSSGKVESGRYISAGDACTIDAVYTNGLCSVTYPTSNGERDAYAKFKDFTPNPVSVSSYKAEKAYTTYTHSDKKNKYGSLSVNDACTVVGQTGNMYQLIYPVKGGYKLGWIDKNDLKDIVKPTPEPNPTQVTTAPLPVAKGFFKGKKVVFSAPKKINLDDGHYISAGDICTIEKMLVNDNGEFTGECKVKYPTNGHNDVFANNCTTRTVTVAISTVLTKYNENYEVYEVPKAIKKYNVYPANKKDAMGHTWYVSKGDKFYTIATSKDADSNKMTEVMYPCTEGTHKGYWKLGWIYLDYFYLDLNGYLDGTYNGNLSGYGYADITVNNEKITKVQDYYKQLPAGSTYSIKNPTALARHTYNGVKTGSLSGTVTAKTQVQLNFTTNPPVLQDIYISSNPSKTEYLEGEWLDTAGLSVTARYDDASTQDVTGSCGITGYDSSPGLKTVNVSFGGYETAFTVNVKSKSLTQIEIVSLPNKTIYNTGDEIDITGLSVKATYDNGTSAIVDDYSLYIDEGATANAGQVSIGVFYVYNEIAQYTSFDITVNQKYTYMNLGDDFTAYIQYIGNGKYVTRIEDGDVRLWSENGSLNQIWHFIKQDGESYKIVSMAADDFNVLDVSGWGDVSETNVGTYYDNDNIEENSTSNQRWYIIQSENGYRLKPQCSECVLDVAGGGDAPDGTNIQIYEYLSYGAQEFNINKIVLATDISIDKTNITLGINETANINVTVQPDDAVGQNIVWTSSDETVAIVDNGTVTAKGLGSATITAKTLTGKTAECIVNVQDSAAIGDVNGDGEVDIADAIFVMKHDAGLTVIDDTFNKAADVNQDGEIDIADAILIMKYDAGLITDFE